MSFWESILGIAHPQVNTQKRKENEFRKEERVAFEELLNGFQEGIEPLVLWRPPPYVMGSSKEKKPENCRNCGSAHTRIKDNVHICSYCGSKVAL